MLTLDGNPRKLCFHSIRHYASSQLAKMAGVLAKTHRDIMGHAGRGESHERYDTPTEVVVMGESIEQLPQLFS